MTLDPVVAWVLRSLLALLFFGAAWHKLRDRRRFESSVAAYRLLPDRWSKVASGLLPVAEVGTAIALLVPSLRTEASAAVGAIIFLYTTAIALNLARGRRDIDCGCFASSAHTPLSGQLIARNLVVFAAAMALLVPSKSRALAWIDGFTIAAAVAATSMLWVASARLARTGPALRPWGGAQ